MTEILIGKDIATWTHSLGEVSKSFVRCNLCGWNDEVMPGFWDGRYFNKEGMNDYIIEHFIKAHTELLEQWHTFVGLIPGAELTFKHDDIEVPTQEPSKPIKRKKRRLSWGV